MLKMNQEINKEIKEALLIVYKYCGFNWKSSLQEAWMDGNYHSIGIKGDNVAILQRWRNTTGRKELLKITTKQLLNWQKV